MSSFIYEGTYSQASIYIYMFLRFSHYCVVATIPSSVCLYLLLLNTHAKHDLSGCMKLSSVACCESEKFAFGGNRSKLALVGRERTGG